MPENANADLDTKFARLRECIDRRNAKGVQDAIFDLSAVKNGWVVPDEVVERLLTLLRCEKMYKSPLAAHGDRFDHILSRQVVAELRHDKYLK
jgi:hypothetical protein